MSQPTAQELEDEQLKVWNAVVDGLRKAYAGDLGSVLSCFIWERNGVRHMLSNHPDPKALLEEAAKMTAVMPKAHFRVPQRLN